MILLLLDSNSLIYNQYNNKFLNSLVNLVNPTEGSEAQCAAASAN